MEITKREVMMCVIISAVMLLIGLFICNSITDRITESNEVYYKAAKITDAEEFQYALKTAIGNALVYGTVEAVQPVSMPEITGEWFYIERIKERYTRHTRTITETDSKGNAKTRTEVYHTWDEVDDDKAVVKQFRFMGTTLDNALSGVTMQEANLSKVAVDQDKVRGNYLYEKSGLFESVGDVRYCFFIIPKSFSVTIEAKIEQDYLRSFEGREVLQTHYEKTILDITSSLEGQEQTASIIFWIVWILIIAGADIGFCYVDNNWLKDNI